MIYGQNNDERTEHPLKFPPNDDGEKMLQSSIIHELLNKSTVNFDDVFF